MDATNPNAMPIEIYHLAANPSFDCATYLGQIGPSSVLTLGFLSQKIQVHILHKAKFFTFEYPIIYTLIKSYN